MNKKDYEIKISIIPASYVWHVGHLDDVYSVYVGDTLWETFDTKEEAKDCVKKMYIKKAKNITRR